MIENATVRFTNGNDVDVDRVKFKDGGWVGLRTGGDWVYYPPQQIARVVSRSEGENL